MCRTMRQALQEIRFVIFQKAPCKSRRPFGVSGTKAQGAPLAPQDKSEKSPAPFWREQEHSQGCFV